MTDDEIRAVGQQFIDSRRQLLTENPFDLDPATVELGNRRWDYIDPLRMGLYVLTMNIRGPWVVNFDHIQDVCTNAAAFAVHPPEGSARAADFNTVQAPVTTLVTPDGAPADHVGPESFSPG